jgi:hypothetical protein
VKRECVPRSARAELSALISLFLPRPIIVRNQWRSNLATKANGTRAWGRCAQRGFSSLFVQRSFSGAELRGTKHFGNQCSWSMVIQEQSRFALFQHGTVAPSPLFNRIDEPMRETSTGIANPAVIDLFGVDQKTGEVLLVMNEPRPWDGSHEQLHEMQEKFNAYASFILDGEMTEAHPELAGRTARIQLRCEYMPGKEALALLQAIHDQLELQAIRVEVVACRS